MRRLLDLPFPSYPQVNKYFTLACFGSPPFLGSVATFIFHGGALWCLFEVVSGRRPFTRDRFALEMTAALWLLVFAYVLSTAINARGWQSLVDVIWIWTLFVFPFSYSIWQISDRRTVAHAVMNASALASYSAFAIAIVQYQFLDMRAEGGAGNPIVFATITAFASAMSLAAAVQAKGWRAIFYYGGFIVGAIAIIYSGTRGIWPAVFANMLLIPLILRRHLSGKPLFRLIAIFVGMLIIVPVFADLMLPRFNWIVSNMERVQAADYSSSVGYRLAMWRAGIEAWRESMLVGFGAGSVGPVVIDRLAGTFNVPTSFTHLHNEIVTILVEAGVLGIAGLVAIVVTAFRGALLTLRRKPSELQEYGATMIIVLMVTFITAGMTSIMIGHDILDAVFVMSLVVGTYLCGRTEVGAASDVAGDD